MNYKTYGLNNSAQSSIIKIGIDWREFEKEWLEDEENLFLSRAYLSGLGSACPEGCRLIFVQLLVEGKAKIQAVFQTMVLDGNRDFKPSQHLNTTEVKSYSIDLSDF